MLPLFVGVTSFAFVSLFIVGAFVVLLIAVCTAPFICLFRCCALPLFVVPVFVLFICVVVSRCFVCSFVHRCCYVSLVTLSVPFVLFTLLHCCVRVCYCSLFGVVVDLRCCC